MNIRIAVRFCSGCLRHWHWCFAVLMTDTIPLFSLASYAKFLRRTKAATTIQKYWRMYVVRRRYKIRRAATIVVQSYLRGYLARNRYRKVSCCFQVCSYILVMLIIFSVYTKYHKNCCAQRSHVETTNKCNVYWYLSS